MSPILKMTLDKYILTQKFGVNVTKNMYVCVQA